MIFLEVILKDFAKLSVNSDKYQLQIRYRNGLLQLFKNVSKGVRSSADPGTLPM